MCWKCQWWRSGPELVTSAVNASIKRQTPIENKKCCRISGDQVVLHFCTSTNASHAENLISHALGVGGFGNPRKERAMLLSTHLLFD